MTAVHNSKLPVPHLEQPRLSKETSYRVSFLEEQTIQTGQTVFTSQLSYTFDDWDGTDSNVSGNIIYFKVSSLTGPPQIVSGSRSSCLHQSWSLLEGSRRPNPRAVGRNASARTCAFCGVAMTARLSCSSPIRSEGSGNDTFLYRVGILRGRSFAMRRL